MASNVKKKNSKKEYTSLFTTVNLDAFYQNLNNLYSPSELIQRIGGFSRFPLLYKDHDIRASIEKRQAALLDTKLMIEGPDSYLNEFFMDQLQPHEDQLKKDLLWSIFNGYGVEQILYHPSMNGTVIGFNREQYWRFEPLPDLKHVILRNSSGRDAMEMVGQVLPYGKWVLTVNDGTTANPWGEPLAESMIVPYLIKCNAWDLWQDFAKRFANGFMHAQISDPEQREEASKELNKTGKSTFIVTDKDTSIAMHMPPRDSSLYSLMEDKAVRALQKLILGETQTSSTEVRGGSASASVHNEVRQEKTWADIRLVSKGLNEIIKQIAYVNGFDKSKLPKASLIYEPTFSVEQASRDVQLNGIGVKFKKQYYVKNYGIDSADFDLEDPKPASSWGFKQRSKQTYLSPEDMKKFIGSIPNEGGCPVHMDAATASRKGRRQEAEKEEIVELLNRNNEPPLNPDDLVAAILTSKNEKELDAKLNALFDQRNNSFVDVMTEGLYLSAARGAMLGNPEVLPNEEE